MPNAAWQEARKRALENIKEVEKKRQEAVDNKAQLGPQYQENDKILKEIANSIWTESASTQADPQQFDPNVLTYEKLLQVYEKLEAERPKLYMSEATYFWLYQYWPEVEFYKRDIRKYMPDGILVKSIGGETETIELTDFLRGKKDDVQ